MNINALNIIKIAITVVSAGVGIATSIVSNKELDMKIAEKVSEALANQNKIES